MPITGIAYADLWVRPATADLWVRNFEALGFSPAGHIHTPETDGHTMIRDHPLARDSATRVIISVVRPGTPADHYLDKYGEGVRDLAFFTTDVAGTYQAMTAAGAEPLFETGWTLGGASIAIARGVGRLRHTLLETPQPWGRSAPPGGFDHVAIAIPAGRPGSELLAAAAFYQAAGFSWAPEQPAGDEHDGMASGVATSGDAVLTLVTPNPRSGQLEQFLAMNGGVAGVQHLALATDDINTMIDEVRRDPRTDIGWVPAPPGWGQNLTSRLPGLPDLHLLIGRGVIAGRDKHGRVLRQIFTQPLVEGCGLFAEAVQRRDPLGSGPDATGFGWDNISELMAAKAASMMTGHQR